MRINLPAADEMNYNKNDIIFFLIRFQLSWLSLSYKLVTVLSVCLSLSECQKLKILVRRVWQSVKP